MCGIALIICGVRIDLSSLLPDVESTVPQPQQVDDPTFTIGALKAALQRRGPEHLGSAKVFFHLEMSSFADNGESVHLFDSGVMTKNVKTSFCSSDMRDDCMTSENEVKRTDRSIVTEPMAEMHFLGATLQFRGITPVSQPLVDDSRNVLVYNGQVFGGLHVDSVHNDTETLMQALGRCCSCHSQEHKIACCGAENGKTSVPELLSIIEGPWALIYWQDSSNTLWFGRDAFGRRSLLVHWPTSDDKRLLLSSVSPLLPVNKTSDFDVEYCMSNLDFWEELSCGIYSIQFHASEFNGCLLGEVRKHEWSDPALKELIKWDRAYVEPKSDKTHLCSFLVQSDEGTVESISLNKDISDSLINSVISSDSNNISKGLVQPSSLLSVHKVLIALRESVMRRTILSPILLTNMGKFMEEKYVPVAVLFSGGLDSMILAALLDKCLDSCYEIDLLNVSFDGLFAPDRIAAKAGVKELKKIAPSRRWNLVEIDADLLKLTSETKHVMSLINPSNTYMDLNIGLALWLAASGDGFINEDSSDTYEKDHQCFKYKSEAKILLVGTGADEQCAGYGRHKTKFKQGGWLRLHEEMKLDMQRIWKRNLGRDDRCIADNGKEARFPFLDEDVIRILLGIPLWEVADLDQPSGRGDKRILREVARLLGIKEAASLPKRAIQFGSRIARESNKKNFGSNRAANQASAGSVVIPNRANCS